MYVWFVCFAPNVALVQLFIQTIIWMPPQQKKKSEKIWPQVILLLVRTYSGPPFSRDCLILQVLH